MSRPSQLAAQWAKISSDRRKAMRDRIIARDGSKCHHCGKQVHLSKGPQGPNDATIDHWPTPKRDLPKDRWLDISLAVLACLSCNRRINHETQKEVVQ